MSTNSTAAADKRARIEAMKAKKAQNDASRGVSLGSTGSDKLTRSANESLSRARVTATIVAPPRPGERCVHVDVKLNSIEDSSAGGKFLMPVAAQGSLFSVLPLTDEQGDYPYKYDEKYRKTTERKPLELGEASITTVKLINAPKGPVDWATSPSLFPGQTITVEGAAAFPIFKHGICIAGKHHDNGQSVAQAALDYEIPSLSFETIANDSGLGQRNMLLSLGMGGYSDAWSLVDATDSTKQFAVTGLNNERNAMLSPDGSWMTAMAKVGAEGDAKWSKDVSALTAELQAGAAFQSSEGFGVDFRVASHGPTILMPVYSLGTEQSLSDGLPGEYGNAGNDGAALSTDSMGIRWKPTFYARRLTLGRLTAGASSMQPMPNLLRQWLYRGILHDIDFVNAHPTIMLGLAMTLRPDSWLRDVPRLASYVADRNALLKDIVRWYGLPGDDFAKTAILVVSNNGELKYWRRKVKSPVSPLKPDLPALVELQREVLWLRGIVLSESAFAPMVDSLKDRIRNLSRNVGRSEEEINRSAFSYIIGHLESMALEAACKVLERNGFKPTSKIYDGCLTTHNPDGDLESTLRAAEAAVEVALGFPGLKLKEKPMYALAPFAIESRSREAARQAAVDAASPLQDAEE